MTTTRKIGETEARVNEPMARAIDKAKRKLRKPRPRPWVVCREVIENGERTTEEVDRRTTRSAACNAAAILFYLHGGRWGVLHEPTGEWVCDLD